ncbi:muscarinic acetylcholine receptor M3 [Sardina pilchardus]|uniref:muscarinic acetylcholine receptor M3 n=1 Tax=Sardina pilchardus TaxID=27697 RepID=UPI002E1400F6
MSLNTSSVTMSLTNTYPGMRDASIQHGYHWPEHEDSNQDDNFLDSSSPLNSSQNLTVPFDPLGGKSVWQVIVIVFFTGSLSLVTVTGNILVLVSFRINKALKTVNNYYLLSLAFADLTIGTLSMNLYTTYIIMDTWALGNWACDLWLAIDYVASNASVMNLLVISFDRYFSVTKPLTYRAKRTTKRAMTMICSAWTISFVLWAPAILFWQFVVGERTVPPGECYIQFLSEPIITFCTAIAAFYLPVSIMTFLFWKIYQETENRSKDLAGLKCSGNKGKNDKANTGASKSNSNTDLNQPVQNDQADEADEDTTEGQTGKTASKSTSATMAKRFASKAKSHFSKRKNQSNKSENKAAQTLSAILLAFIITWTPYNIMVLVNTFCTDCIPETLWSLGYWLCYVNSTINPMCYALCNKNFRDTFKMILLCQWNMQKQNKPHFQQRQAPASRKKEPK